MYLGYNAAWGNIIAAVDATKGQVASYNGSVIELNYSSSNGGYTELPKNVWGGSASGAPYFVVKEDPYDLAALPENVYGLAAYEYNIESLDTVAQALTGAFVPAGKLPVPLEGGQP